MITRRSLLAPLTLMLVTAAIAWPAIAVRAGATPTESDQIHFHSAVITQMAAQLPWPRLSEYNAAMAPGYHLALAVIVRATGAGPIALQWINSLIGLALVGVAASVAARFTSPWRAAALALPLAVSNHVVSASIWIATDNPAWLCIALALAAMMRVPRSPHKYIWQGSAWAAAGTAIRQIHVWLAVPLFVAAYMSKGDRKQAVRRAAIGALVIALPVALLIWLWGGLTPPAFRAEHNDGVNLTALPFTLSCVGAFGLAFLPLAAPRFDRRMRAVMATAAALGAALAAVIPTSFDHEHGRWGGVLWNLVARTPAFAGRSALMIVLAAIGAATIACLWRSARDRGRADEASVLLVALAALATAQAANSMVWERYFEPAVLLVLAWLTAMGATSIEPPQKEKRRWAALGILVALLIAVTLSSIYLRPYVL